MNLEEWDREIKPHLEDIDVSSGWIKFYAEKIAGRVRRLQYQPNFASKAEDNLTEAIVETEKALFALKQARESFRAKQVLKN